MNEQSDEPEFENKRKMIIGLGESSSRKNYYPALLEQLSELKRKNEELQAANEEIIATEEELHQNYRELLQKEQELLESRANFQEVLENSIVALYKLNFLSNSYDYISPAIHSIFGYTPVEMMQFSVNDIAAMIHPDDFFANKKVIEEIVDHGGGQCALEYRFKHKNGQKGWAKDIFQIFIDSSGKPLYSIGSIQNITNQKRDELTLQTAQKKLNLLNNVTFQDVLNANFALSGYIQLMRDSNTNEKIFAFQDAAETLIHKIEDSLKYAKYFQDMGINPPLWHNMSLVILNAISHLDALHSDRIIHLEGLECYADPLLEHALFIIIENFFLHGEGATQLSITNQEKSGYLTIIIEDNGIGIPDDNKEKIFEKSFGRKKGMGLYLVKEILSITGITIKENGIWRNGARFEILIPPGGFRFDKSLIEKD